MKRILKYFLIGLGTLTAIAIIFVSTMIAINAWPRTMEPRLWTEADLAISVDPEKNGWNIVPKRGDFYIYELIPDGWLTLIDNHMNAEQRTNAILFWEQALDVFEELADNAKKRNALLKLYDSLFKYPQFVDTDPATLDKKRPDILYLRDLHSIGLIHIFENFLEGRRDAAYSFWLKLFNLDKKWLFSARSLISNFAAIDCIKGDLFLFDMMSRASPPKEWKSFDEALSELDPTKISFKRALIYEYNWAMNAIENIIPEELIEYSEQNVLAKWYTKTVFNKPLIRNDFNKHFELHASLIEKPDQITEEMEQELDDEITNLTKGPFWWFYNPAGKLLRSIMSANLISRMKMFYEDKREIEKCLTEIQALRKTGGNSTP